MTMPSFCTLEWSRVLVLSALLPFHARIFLMKLEQKHRREWHCVLLPQSQVRKSELCRSPQLNQ